MPERLNIVDVDKESESFKAQVNPDGDCVILTPEDQRLIWDEFKAHCFRRDEVNSEKVHRIFNLITEKIEV